MEESPAKPVEPLLSEGSDGEPPLITRMDTASPAQWRRLAEAQRAAPVADRVLAALRLLEPLYLGFPVSQLTHSLQTATRAERAGADGEMTVAALCHDVGRVLPGGDHAAVAAAMLRPYVRPEVCQVIRVHWAFQLRYTHPSIPGSRPEQRRRYRRRPWYPLAERFSDEWDQRSQDPAYDTLPLEHFEPLVRAVFGRPVYRRAAAGRLRRAAGDARVLFGV